MCWHHSSTRGRKITRISLCVGLLQQQEGGSPRFRAHRLRLACLWRSSMHAGRVEELRRFLCWSQEDRKCSVSLLSTSRLDTAVREMKRGLQHPSSDGEHGMRAFMQTQWAADVMDVETPASGCSVYSRASELNRKWDCELEINEHLY